MTDFSQYITDGLNSVSISCLYCNSKILTSKSASLLQNKCDLPQISQNKDNSGILMEEVTDWWVVDNMFTFENIGFTYVVGSIKYLSCADCDRGPLGYHDISSQKNYIALSRVKHE